MLKNRLIPCILVRDGILVQSIGFSRYLPIGKPKIAIEYFNRWDVDEIIVLDISPEKDEHVLIDLTRHISKIAFIPLTVGGGIRSIDGISSLLQAGADKVSLNTEACHHHELLRTAVVTFGSQDIVVSIDAKKNDRGHYEVYTNGGREPTGLTPTEWAQEAESLGAGEILLNSIDRDGAKTGYDIDLIKSVTNHVHIPVIAIGGVGNVNHFPDAILKGKADAVSAANIFQHIEHSTIQAKAAMKNAGINVRIATKLTYANKMLHSVPINTKPLGGDVL